MKAFKKAIAIMLALVFVLSLVPFGALAEVEATKTTAKFEFTPTNTGVNADRLDFGFIRTDKDGSWDQKAEYTGTESGNLYYGLSLSSMYQIFVQLDLTGYEEILRNDSTTLCFMRYTSQSVIMTDSVTAEFFLNFSSFLKDRAVTK